MPDSFWNTCTAVINAARQENDTEAARLVELAERLLSQENSDPELLLKRKSYFARLKQHALHKSKLPHSGDWIPVETPDEKLFYPRPINDDQREKLGISRGSFTVVATSNGMPVIDNAVRDIAQAAESLNKNDTALNVILVNTSEYSQEALDWPNSGKHLTVLSNIARNELPNILSIADMVVFIGQEPDPANAARRLEVFAMGRPVILVRGIYQPPVEHRKDSYVINSLQADNLTESILAIRKDKGLAEQLGRSSVEYYLRAQTRRGSHNSESVKQPETPKPSPQSTSNPPATAKAINASPNIQKQEIEIGKLRKIIKQLEADNSELSERLLSMPSIDPLCISDPGFTWPDRNLEEFGIIVFGHTRLDALGAVLESLKRQDALKYTEVWLDGYQGNHQLRLRIQKTIDLVKTYPVKHLHTQAGNYGFRKMLILGLAEMCRKYRDILILEDDCFPTRDAVSEFRKELDLIREDRNIFSVYGHHFRMESEKETCARFQGWGWATTSDKLMPMLRQLIDCYSMPEVDYLKFVRNTLTPKIKAQIDVTHPRQPSFVLENFFAWDETLCLLSALNQQVHKPTKMQTIYNCGMGKGSTHFEDIEMFRKPPFNLITPDEVWQYF
jgi:hypothetical protein